MHHKIYLFFCSAMIASGQASAQQYPAKPIRVVIGGSPGSNADIFFRIVQARMGGILGQPLVADYRPGAGGAIGANITVKSPPDGYTIMMVARSEERRVGKECSYRWSAYH